MASKLTNLLKINTKIIVNYILHQANKEIVTPVCVTRDSCA